MHLPAYAGNMESSQLFLSRHNELDQNTALTCTPHTPEHTHTRRARLHIRHNRCCYHSHATHLCDAVLESELDPTSSAERGRGWLVGLSCVCVVGKAHPGGLTRVNQSHSKNINSHPSKRCKVFTRGREKCELLRPRPRGCGVRLPRRGVPLLRLRFHMWYTVL
jgi:hypothetical protein